MATFKYGLDTRTLTQEYREKLISLESYLSHCNVRARNLREGDAFWLALETAYQFKIDRTLSFPERIGVCIMYLTDMSKSKRRAFQRAARARKSLTVEMPKTAEPKAPKAKIKPVKAFKLEMPPSKREKEMFYASWEWTTLRKKVLNEFGPRCQCCGATKEDVDTGGKRIRIQVDHIKPLHHHWSLRLDQSNLQVLCHECNMGKGAWDETDHRF